MMRRLRLRWQRLWGAVACGVVVLGGLACGGDDEVLDVDAVVVDAARGDARPIADGDVVDAAAADATVVDAASGDASATACGGATCGPAEICVHPCNCGVLGCLPVPDSGMCPDGYDLDYCFGGAELSCVGCPPPPPPFCAPRPAACDDDCSCFDTDPCWERGGSCGLIEDAGVACLCA